LAVLAGLEPLNETFPDVDIDILTPDDVDL
jgi:hypothetical protein